MTRRTYRPGLVARPPYTGWCPYEECGQEIKPGEQAVHTARHERAGRLQKAARRKTPTRARPQGMSERQQRDLKRSIAAAKLEAESARTADPELSRHYALEAARIRRAVENGE